jgi:hypothetical protein
MSRVMRCMCEECFHNDNFECKAEDIEIRSSVQNNKVRSSEETCCNTFKHGHKK